jgi:hypothetical protein
MNNPTSILEQAKRRIGAAGTSGGMMRRVRGETVFVLTLILLFLTVGVVGKSDLDVSTLEARLAPTGIVAPTTATLSRDPNPDGWNEDLARVTLSARFKTH